MSQTMTLSEPLLGLAGRKKGVYAPRVGHRSPSRAARIACNGFGDLLLAASMVLLAPLAVVLLAGAFVLACWRMQWLETDDQKDRVAALPEPARVPVPVIETTPTRFLLESRVQSAHLWN
jgi:hypothetical protein